MHVCVFRNGCAQAEQGKLGVLKAEKSAGTEKLLAAARKQLKAEAAAPVTGYTLGGGGGGGSGKPSSSPAGGASPAAAAAKKKKKRKGPSEPNPLSVKKKKAPVATPRAGTGAGGAGGDGDGGERKKKRRKHGKKGSSGDGGGVDGGPHAAARSGDGGASDSGGDSD